MTVDDFLPLEPTGRLERAELRGDLPGALRYAAILVVIGLPLGALWALLAPVVHIVALPGAGTGSPAGEADHAFDAVAIHVLLVASFGVIAGAVAWRRRHRRGPVLLVAAAVGSWWARSSPAGWAGCSRGRRRRCRCSSTRGRSARPALPGRPCPPS